MAILNLESYSSIYISMFVKIDVPNYEVLRFSNHFEAFTIIESDGTSNSYTNIGDLASVSDTTFGIRNNSEEVTVTIVGLPLSNISMVLNNEFKGSKIEIRRQFFNGSTLAPIGNSVIKFKGILNNYNIIEEYPDTQGGVGSCSIGFICGTLTDLLQEKRAGRRTNPLDQKIYFPNDLSMDRVPNISGSNYNFGAAL
jgi:hypothetical protein